jgi:hypothetical protein
MEKEFVNYELALRLKVLGFDEPCFGYYTNHSHLVIDEIASQQGNTEVISAPTWQSAFDWFGEKYQLYASVVVDQTTYPKYAYEISRFIGNPKDLTEEEWDWDSMIFSPSLYRTTVETRLYCLTELLNFVEEKDL